MMFLKAHSLQEAGTDIRAPLFIFLFLSFSSRLKWLKIALQTLDLTEEGAGEKKKKPWWQGGVAGEQSTDVFVQRNYSVRYYMVDIHHYTSYKPMKCATPRMNRYELWTGGDYDMSRWAHGQMYHSNGRCC